MPLETVKLELKAKFGAEIEKHPGVKFNGTFVDEEGRGICDWEAPSAEVVKGIVNAVLGDEAPVDEIVEVKRVL